MAAGKMAVAPRAFVAMLGAGSLLALAACGTGGDRAGESGGSVSDQSTDHFGYLVDTPLVTTNAASNTGASSNTEALSGRLYPAVFVPGPSGQMIPNTDLVRTQVLPGANRQVIYTITEDARYSDDVPVTCTDFLLHVKAGQHEGLFGSHLPLTREILRIDCEPGQKRFTVVFDDDGGGRWRHLFGPGSVLPAHAIAERAGMTTGQLHEALRNDDLASLQEVARLWREGFNLDGFDPQLQVSSGPFVVDSVGDQGEVILAPNEHFVGDAPRLDRIVVWPRETDPRRLIEEGALRVADVRGGEPEWLDRNDPTNDFTVESRVGDLTDSLLLGDAGVFATAEARQAFAACVDQGTVAAASSKASGIDVPPVTLHSLPHNDPMAVQLQDLTAPQVGVDIARAQALAGATVRIGYIGEDERKAAMVAEIVTSCEAAGITVVDASAEAGTLADLTRSNTGQEGEPLVPEGQLDAVLQAVDPMAEVGGVSARASEVEQLRSAESTLWEEVPSIPLSAQPRRFVIDRTVGNVVVYTGLAGIGWNMDRWHVSEDDDAREDPGSTR